ncbi:MAG: DUF72 domain-containing protein [Hyphomicrobiales bacterium]|nr:DUF72 domain-containing protein [Hyphomicrobiales bacterium]
MIRVGIGGWTFAPWRGVFYPKGLPQTRELEHASRQLTSIEINGTFYSTQKPATFRKWAAETPDDFVFSVKGSRYVTHRRILAEAGESITRFLNSGLSELGDKLGPILWQMHPGKRFEPDDFAAFLALLPEKLDGRSLRHAVEVRHESFVDPAFVTLLRKYSVAAVLVESDKHPLFADVTSDFVYARLQHTSEKETTGYPPMALDAWAARAQTWARGGAPDDLVPVAGPPSAHKSRDVFIYMISGAKVRAPAAAMALMERL